MRAVVVILLTAAFAGLSGSSAAAPEAPAVRNVSYLLHAQFDLDYKYDWVQTTGDRTSECSYWTDTRGSNAISAGSLRWIPGQLKLVGTSLPPFVTVSSSMQATGSRPVGGTKLANGSWVGGKILANGRAETNRRLVHRGGTTAGCITPPTPFQVPRTDCGERAYETKSASLHWEMAGSGPTLETLLERGPFAAIRLSVPPTALQYRSCDMPAFPPAYPLSLPVLLRRGHTAKLQTLDEGEVLNIPFSRAGDCKLDPDPRSSCHFDLDITLKIRRWVTGTRFP